MSSPPDDIAAGQAPPLSDSKGPHSSETETPSTNATEESRYSPRTIKAWGWELFAFLTGTAAFVSILAVLFSFQNKSAGSFNTRTSAGEIQITAVIAALAQVAQTALLVPISYSIGQLKWQWFKKSNRAIDLDRFDLASRGPDGSVQLLWHLRWRQRLVSVGALATILMLVFPTFVQQAVKVGDMNFVELDGSQAIMPRARSVEDTILYNAKVYTLTGNGTASSYEVDMKLNDALRNGIANMNPIDALGNWQAPYNSETSLGGRCWSTSNANCSWGAFNTLALCSSMQDVSRDITLENKRVSLPALKDFLQTDSEAPSFRSGLHGYTGENNRYAITYPPTSASDGANLPALAEVYYLFYDSCVDRDIFDLSNTTFWKAYKGTFQFCAQTINATTASPYDDTFTSTMTLIDSTTNLKWTQKTQYGNISHFCTALDGEEEDFCVSEPFMQRLAFQMNLMFNSTAIFRNANRTDIRYSSEWGPLLADLVYENGCDPIFTHDIKFQDMLEGIGQSLTDKFRVDANVTDSVFGTFTHAERVIKVDFRWLILPIVLWVIITIFFFSTMVKTRHTPMWKSSVLPLLHMMRSEDTPAEDYMIKKEAAETWVGLTRTQKGWRVWNSAEEGDVNKEGELRKRRAAAGSTDGGGNN